MSKDSSARGDVIFPEACLPPECRDHLRQRLLDFYNSVADYSAFQAPSQQRQCWGHLAAWIRSRISDDSSRRLRILEIGAGRSGFGSYLAKQGIRHHVDWICQDVTPANRDWLEKEADQVWIGDEQTFAGARADLVFSTYVFEHVINPSAHLSALREALFLRDKGGTVMIFSPKYDIPGYLCPSTRHLSRRARIRIAWLVAFHRLQTLVTGRPSFLIQTDLAAFSLPFFTDADAAHWVSGLDLAAWAGRNGARLQRLPMRAAKSWSRDAVIKRHATLAARLDWPSPGDRVVQPG